MVLWRVLLSSLPFCGVGREFLCILSFQLFQFCGLGGLLCPFTSFWLRRYPGICSILLYHVSLTLFNVVVVVYYVMSLNVVVYYIMFSWCCCSMLLFITSCYSMLLFNVVVYYIMFFLCCCLLHHVTRCCCSMLLFIISCCLMWLFSVVHNRLELTYFVYFSYWIQQFMRLVCLFVCLFGLCPRRRQGYCVEIHYRVYSSSRDFGSLLGNNNRSNLIWGFLKDDIFWLVLELEISYYRVMISWRVLVSFRGIFFERVI